MRWVAWKSWKGREVSKFHFMISGQQELSLAFPVWLYKEDEVVREITNPESKAHPLVLGRSGGFRVTSQVKEIKDSNLRPNAVGRSEWPKFFGPRPSRGSMPRRSAWRRRRRRRRHVAASHKWLL